MVAIRSEHDTQNRRIQAQKYALDGVIADLSAVNLMGKDKSRQASPATPVPEGDGSDVVMDNGAEGPEDTDSALDLEESGEIDEKEDGEDRDLESLPNSLKPSIPDTSSLTDLEDDIEMGEVAEDHKIKGKKKVREEELEEGEASDSSSELSDPPDD